MLIKQLLTNCASSTLTLHSCSSCSFDTIFFKILFSFSVFGRILNLFAEENAVEDTIYYLSESLRKEAIDLEIFLKVTHQYMYI